MQKEIKSLASDTLIYGVFTIAGRFLTFMLTPIYTNYMSVKANGEIAIIFTLIAFLAVINSFGMDAAFFRFYDKNDLQQSKKVFTHAYIYNVIVGGLSSIFVIIFAGKFAPFISDSPDGWKYVQIGILIPFFDTLMVVPYGLLRMTRRAWRFAGTRFGLILLAIILNLLFLIIFRWGLEGVLLAQLLTNICGFLIFLPEIIHHFSKFFDFKLFKDMFKFGLPTLPASFSSIILQLADRPILKELTDFSQVAIYTVNYRLGIPMLLFAAVFDYAYKPFYLSHFEQKDAKYMFSRIITYFTLVGSIVFLVTSLFIEFIVKVPFIGGRFINPAYWSGMYIIPLILGGYYFNGMFNNLAAGFYITKRTNFLPIAVGIGAASNIVINLILIPIMGYSGAAWATLIAYFISVVILFVFSRKIYPMKYDFKRIFTIWILSVFVNFSTIYLTNNLDLTLKFGIRIAALVLYVLILWLIKFFTPGELISLKSMFRIKKIPQE